MTNEEAFQALLPLVGEDTMPALELLYANARANVRPTLDKEDPNRFITYKQYKFLVSLAVAGGSTLAEELASHNIEPGNKPWHIEKQAGKLLIDEFIKLGYRENLPSYHQTKG